ncbi:ATP-binding protein [Wukongibacter baidiensis]|uniref:ATP-binding protein n=1 Tax=Wukongibacter baidiensis TaxID=1723361 RepID=UPI003D7FFDDB
MIPIFLSNMMIMIGFICVTYNLNDYFSKKEMNHKLLLYIISIWNGFASLLIMSQSFNYKGMRFDLRSIPIFIISYRFGWKAGLIAAILPSLYRFYIGGSTLWIGIAVAIILPGIIGSIAHKRDKFIGEYSILNKKNVILSYIVYSVIRAILMWSLLPVSPLVWINLNILLTGISLVALCCIVRFINNFNAKNELIRRIKRKQKRIDRLLEALKRSNNTLHALIDTMPVGIIVVDTKGDIILTNSSIDMLLGDNKNKFAKEINKTIGMVYTFENMEGDEIKPHQMPLWKSIKNNMVIKDKEILVRNNINGKERIILMASAPVLDIENNVASCIAIMQDITHIKEAEMTKNIVIEELSEERKKLEENNRMLTSLANRHIEALEDLYEKTEELEKANRVKSDFIANVSHELRTPLNITMSYLEYLLEEEEVPLKDEQREMIDIAYKNAERLQYLISDLLDISFFESNGIKLNYTNVNMKKFLSDIVKDRLLLIKDMNIDIELSVPEEDIEVATDWIRLRQVIDNILDNSVKFTNEGTIEIKLKRDENKINIYISDAGIGIEENKIEDVFKPFYQGDYSSKKKYKGVGLGLYIAQKIIKNMGGEISAENNTDKGCCFIVSLPIYSKT